MRFRVFHWRCFIHDKFSSFNNLDLIADKPLRWRFIGPCKLFEGLPGEGSLSCVSGFIFHTLKKNMKWSAWILLFFNAVYLSRFWLMKGGSNLLVWACFWSKRQIWFNSRFLLASAEVNGITLGLSSPRGLTNSQETFIASAIDPVLLIRQQYTLPSL